MDNAQIHHAHILDYLHSKLNIFFVAPYSPFLNMIEEVFSLFKFKLRKKVYPSRNALLYGIFECLSNIK